MKYFYENAPEYAIICAGSLLGIALYEGTSFPVGKVDFLDLYPFSFKKFLLSLNESSLVEILNSKGQNLNLVMKSKFITRFKEYYFVGGIPESILTFIEKNDFNKVRQIQKIL